MAKDLGARDSSVLCPICLRSFPRGAVSGKNPKLTIEHILPKAIGSSAETLTCTTCNSGETKNIESDLVGRVAYVHALNGRGGSVPAWMHTEKGKQLIRVSVAQDGTVEMVGCEGSWKNPEAKALIAELENGEFEKFDLKFPKVYDGHRSQVALLKAAYLFLFRAFGYRYIQRPTLDIVRQQILDPNKRLQPSRFIAQLDVDHEPSVLDGRATYLVCEKADFLLILLDIDIGKVIAVPMPNSSEATPTRRSRQ